MAKSNTWYHPDLTVRYAKQIKQGKIRLIAKQDISIKAFLLEKIGDKGMLWLMVPTLSMAIGLKWLDWFEKNYASQCAILNGFSAELISSIVFFALFFLYTLGCSVALWKVMSLSRHQHWHEIKRLSNRYYRVEKYFSDSKLMVIYWLKCLLVSGLLVTTGFTMSQLIYPKFKKYGSLSQINQVFIKSCKIRD